MARIEPGVPGCDATPTMGLEHATDPPDPRYAELIAREREHWSGAGQDPDNPQIWDDPELFRIVLEPPYRAIVDRAVAAGGPALELGCGDGDLSLDLARRGLEVTGLDLSPTRVERARALTRDAGLASRARFEAADLNECPLCS